MGEKLDFSNQVWFLKEHLVGTLRLQSAVRCTHHTVIGVFCHQCVGRTCVCSWVVVGWTVMQVTVLGPAQAHSGHSGLVNRWCWSLEWPILTLTSSSLSPVKWVLAVDGMLLEPSILLLGFNYCLGLHKADLGGEWRLGQPPPSIASLSTTSLPGKLQWVNPLKTWCSVDYCRLL